MPRRLTRISLAFLLVLSGEVWALGLGEVRLESALNEPLRADIELLSASPEELTNLVVDLASADTFERYGIDRPFYLQDLVFEVIRSGRADGNYVRVRSTAPMTEPFLTFLVEATYARGRLLREYTVLLDPPTFAPPRSAQTQPAISAPQSSATVDSGQIDRAPAPRTTPAPPAARTEPAADTRPPPRPAPKPAPVADNTPFDTTAGGDYVVRRSETLWGIAQTIRPDSRLSMNQIMLAIYQANPDAFGGNINLLREGASLRIPSADEIYSIDRGSANSEVERQHSAWDGSDRTPTPAPADPEPATDSRPSLTLVPPDEEPVGIDTGVDAAADGEPMTREQAVLDRIAEIEAADVPDQPSLIEIRDNELANLRRELAEIRGEPYEPPVDDAADDPFVDDTTDDAEPVPADAAPDVVDDVVADDPVDTSATISRPATPSLMDRVMGALSNYWTIIGGALIVAIGLLFWFMRRGSDDPDSWGALDADEMGEETMATPTMTSTESLRAPSREDEAFVVVEQESSLKTMEDDTMDVAAPDVADTGDATDQFGSLEDTFSSDTAINLDQSDPIAEADFHMAYGLYDQAADLINGALAAEPQREDLLTKLCEIYFVWGNRDSFVDAAEQLRGAVGGGSSASWDKIVIMGQQIAGDHAMFAGAGVGAVTKEVDLSFEADSDASGALDMDFGADGGGDDVIDLGSAGDGEDAVDFLFEQETGEQVSAATGEQSVDFSVTSEMPTVEMPTGEPTVETPTIEEQFSGFDSSTEATSELPSISPEALEATMSGDTTAEINLDDLGLDVDGLAETEVASMDDLDDTGTDLAMSGTGLHAAFDDTDQTGKNLALDESVLDLDDELASTADMRLASDETGTNPMLDSIEQNLLEATGRTQVLSETLAVGTGTGIDSLGDEDETLLTRNFGDDDDRTIADEDATLLAPGEGDEADFDFAKTEALPPDAFGGSELDETGEIPALASTDVHLDLDDLTAALKVSEMGDTVDMPGEEATVEQPRPNVSSTQAAQTVELTPADMSDDLHEARTMTEVGTKLDLARAYVDMGDPAGARSILEEVLDEGDEGQRQQAQQLLNSLPT